MPPSAITNLDADVVREAARDRWKPVIFPALGIAVRPDKRHGPCPHCGGKDRGRCDDRNGTGSWYCNVCEPHAGDGFAMVMKMRGCDFPDALRLVAGALGLSSHPRPAPRPAKLDRVAIAFRYDLAAFDLRLRAARIIDAGKNLNVAMMTTEELDRALGHMGRAYDDVERAELFESVADGLRERDFIQREKYESVHTQRAR